MNSKLPEAVAIFKELGWENITPENILALPLGTTEQKRTALEGLQSGEWGEIANLGDNRFGWRGYTDADTGKLALFAIRIGISAQRAVNIAASRDSVMLAIVVAERGAKFAANFINFACKSNRRWSEHSASTFGNTAVRLVHMLNLEIPQSAEYMKDWSVYAAVALNLKAATRYNETSLPGLDVIEKGFGEHITTGVTVGVPATGPFGAVLPEGVKHGWLERDKAVDLCFIALDAAVRPGDRKVWLGVLDKLDIQDEELCARAQELIPLLSSGDAIAVARLSPVLIAQVEEHLLAEVVLASFSVDTKKARRLVLKAILNRSCPLNTEDLIPWLSILADDADKSISALAIKVSKHWGLNAVAPPKEKTAIQGLWRITPPVWHLPTLELGNISPADLTELAAEMMGRQVQIHDITAERFLAMANAVARQNPDSARMSLRGLRPGDSLLLYYLTSWVKGKKPVTGRGKNGEPVYGCGEDAAPLTARDHEVCLRLGELPCILSLPSSVDLSISIVDLTKRLTLYKQTQTSVLEADLFLALTRLDTKTKTPESILELQKLDLPIILVDTKTMPVTAGHAVLRYLDNPIKEPSLSGTPNAYWYKEQINISGALPHFPNRFHNYVQEPYSIFPLWGDVVLGAIAWNYYEVNHGLGLVLRQAARRATPLPPGASINILASQRSLPPTVAEDCIRAVIKAWKRGLLRPGVAAAELLDRGDTPSSLAALATVLEGFAQDGLLSVIWPIVDALIAISFKAPRMLAGTAELAELIALFLPEVQYAVEQGIADADALALPGIRGLALRGGASRAVTAAKQITAQLPNVQAPEQVKKITIDPPFEEVWQIHKNALPIEDGVSITIDCINPTASTQVFLFRLVLPDIAEHVFHIVKGWYYDMESEGQCQAYAAAPNAVEFRRENEVWLYWDETQKRLLVSQHRNRATGGKGPLQSAEIPPFSASLLTVMIGLLAQDGDAAYFAPRLLRDFINNEQIGVNMVRRATQTLLQNPVVSPAKLVRVLEKDIKLLSVLWPMLTECVKAAGRLEKPPVWVNRILDIALRYAPYLLEAVRRGLIPAEDAQWAGLSEIASSKSKSGAVKKAKGLIKELL